MRPPGFQDLVGIWCTGLFKVSTEYNTLVHSNVNQVRKRLLQTQRQCSARNLALTDWAKQTINNQFLTLTARCQAHIQSGYRSTRRDTKKKYCQYCSINCAS